MSITIEDTVLLTRICVAIPTYERPTSLKYLLTDLDSIDVPNGTQVEIVVLDNAAEPTVEAIVLESGTRSPHQVTYFHVPTPGLAAVRNAALNYALFRAEFLAMIDDDERPTRRWLCELLRVQGETGADAVIGPVPSRFPSEAPAWLRHGKFLEPRSLSDGQESREGHSGNCLLRTASVARLRLSFDSAFNFSGGEDLIFFRDLIAGGGRLVFAALAVAHEDVQPERCSARHVLKVYFRRGNTLSLSDLRSRCNFVAIAVRFLKALARIALGLLTALPRSLFRGFCGSMESACDIALGSGALVGLLGQKYQGYDRPRPGDAEIDGFQTEGSWRPVNFNNYDE